MEPEVAHKGMIKNPASAAWNGAGLKFGVCEKCHSDVSKTYASSLHYSQNGFRTTLEAFTHKNVLNEENGVSKGFNLNCGNCHADCGECHVRNPRAVKGGLISGHKFEKVAPIKTCYGCHGARNAGEFVGDVGPTADVHYYDYDMVCTDCHEKSNFHGDESTPVNLHEAKDTPKCITADCHPDTMSAKKGIKMHLAHKDQNLLACNVCHSQEAHGCSNCHISFTDSTQKSVYSQSTPIDVVKIAKNPNPSVLHPEKFILVRHIPSSKDMFANVGYPILENFDKVSNWRRSPTHNVQRNTPQASSCNSCHGVKKVFLTEEDISATDSKASKDYVVKTIPQIIKNEK